MSYFFLYNPKFWTRGGFPGGGESPVVLKRKKKKDKKLKEQLLAKIHPMPIPVITELEAIPEIKVKVEDRYLEEDFQIALLVGLL